MVSLDLLLQIDATIIAGALILLTITSFVKKDTHIPIGIHIGRGRGIVFTPYQVATGAITSFSVSALGVLGNNSEIAFLTAIIGFGWLIASSSVIAGKEQFDSSNTSNK